jgi:predicted Rossmann fold nucleotide-binding protein DprA/Smf involved in DNA uptake
MASTQLPPGAVHPDTQAILLLCGTFARRGGPAAKPLTLSEYNALASWLGRQGKRPAALLEAAEGSFSFEEPGLPAANRIRILLDRGFQMAAALERWHRLGLWVIGRGEDSYPERLRQHLRSAAPPLLFGAGDISRLGRGGLAVVGSRDIDEEGLSFTRQVGERCAGQSVQIISGGARGVDRAAVTSVLQGGGGAVAVLADRLDHTATSREAKEPLRSGLLTLVTPYEPESVFTIDKAIGRNKHIYALADNALIVRFRTGKGGTWAGAIEQLVRNKSASVSVPVFVRVANNPKDGLEELRNRGALSFTEEDFFTKDISELLRPTISAPDPSAVPVESAPPSPAAPAPDTCYHRCLPLLMECFQQEIGIKQLPEIAEKLQLLRSQLEDWLQRAIEEGKLTKKKKRGRVFYVDASAAAEQTLFDRDGDAA